MLEKIELFLEDKNVDKDLINRLSFVCLGGSHVSGTNDNTSDYDYRGIIIPNEDYLLGLKGFEHSKLVSGQQGINTKDDIDIELFSVARFIHDLFHGEIVAHEMLHCENEFVLRNHELLQPIFKNKERFVSKMLVFKYQSMIKGYVKKMSLPKENLRRKDNIERVEQYGFETKCAMKSVQLLRLCVEYLQTGKLNLKRKDSKYLLSIKRGKVSYESVMKEVNDLRKQLNNLLNTTDIPKKPEFNKVNEFKKSYMKSLLLK